MSEVQLQTFTRSFSSSTWKTCLDKKNNFVSPALLILFQAHHASTSPVGAQESKSCPLAEFGPALTMKTSQRSKPGRGPASLKVLPGNAAERESKDGGGSERSRSPKRNNSGARSNSSSPRKSPKSKQKRSKSRSPKRKSRLLMEPNNNISPDAMLAFQGLCLRP